MNHSIRLYTWQGTDANGLAVNGQTPGRSPAYVRAGLLRQGILVASLRPAGGLVWRWPKRPEKTDPAGFSRQLATLLQAGMPVKARYWPDTRQQPVLAARYGKFKGLLAAAKALQD